MPILHPAAQPIDPSVADFVFVLEVDDGPAFAEGIFQRKYGQPAPTFGRHFVALYRQAADRFVPAGYVHVTDCHDIGLAGGACTDGRAIALMDAAQRQALGAAGGLYLQVMRHAFAALHDAHEAFFGLCGDPRSWEVSLQAGFEPTATPQLLVYCPRPLSAPRLTALTAKARSFMPF
jgi:hypothetical protein